MTIYNAPIEDIKFVTEDLLDIYSHYKKYPDYDEATPEVVDMVITECAKFCETELAPLNQSGDKEGTVKAHDEGFKPKIKITFALVPVAIKLKIAITLRTNTRIVSNQPWNNR